MHALLTLIAPFVASLFWMGDAPVPTASADTRAPVILVASFQPPEGDLAGAAVRGRAWTYDSAVSAAALAAGGRVDEAGAILDAFSRLQRRDGALEHSYAVTGDRGDGPQRSGVQAWVGLAALQWRRTTCSGRHDELLIGLTRWLLDRRISAPDTPGFGLLQAGPDVTWVSTEHNLEARAFFAGVAAELEGRPGPGGCSPGLDGLSRDDARRLARRLRATVVDLDAGIDRALLVLDGPGRAHLRQGVGDDAQPVDVQALGALWLAGRGRTAQARAVIDHADATMLVRGRTVEGAGDQTFSGYRPFADAWGPDVLWLEGTLQMRSAKAAVGRPTAELDDSIARWLALTAPGMPLQVDRAAGSDYHVWPAAGPAAWFALNHTPFALLKE